MEETTDSSIRRLLQLGNRKQGNPKLKKKKQSSFEPVLQGLLFTCLFVYLFSHLQEKKHKLKKKKKPTCVVCSCVKSAMGAGMEGER